MSKIGETLLETLNKMLPNPHDALWAAKQDPFSYKNFFEKRSISSFAEFGELDFTDQAVLDVGCGLGANLIHLCNLGARSVTGLDISPIQLNQTQTIFAEHHAELSDRIQFVQSDATAMPFADAHFDALVSADTFEHIDALRPALQECARVLKPGGRLLAYFPPFYAPWGAHMINWIRVPWCQVFFSEKTVLNLARRLEREGQSINNLLPPETRLDLEDGDTIPFVSHLTVGKFRQAVHSLPEWRIVKERLLSPNWRTSRWWSRLIRLAYSLLSFMQRLQIAGRVRRRRPHQWNRNRALSSDLQLRLATYQFPKTKLGSRPSPHR